MSKIEKFKSNPTYFTWYELVKVLNYLGYFEKITKRKTGGSRVKFVNDENDVINLYKPHP